MKSGQGQTRTIVEQVSGTIDVGNVNSGEYKVASITTGTRGKYNSHNDIELMHCFF